jgi:hypothetical protein
MAQTGFTPILIYSSSTTTNAPAVGNLTNSTLGSELAINITDGKLFYKDNANAIQVIGWKVVPTTAGGTGLTTYAQGDLLYYNSGTTFATLAKSTTATRYLSNTGASNNPAWAQIDLTNGVTGDLPFANLAQGSALSVLGVTGNATADVASIAAASDHQVLRRSGTAVAFGAVNLAQSNAVTGTLAVGNGGTGIASLATNYIPYGAATSAFASSANLQFTGTQLRVNGAAGGYTIDNAGSFRQTGGATTKTGSTASLGASGTEDVYTGNNFDSFYVIAHGNGNTTQWSAAIVYFQAGGGVNVAYINAGAIGIGSGGAHTIRLTNSGTTQSIGYTIFYFAQAV